MHPLLSVCVHMNMNFRLQSMDSTKKLAHNSPFFLNTVLWMHVAYSYHFFVILNDNWFVTDLKRLKIRFDCKEFKEKIFFRK